jgi:FdhD protein
MQEIIRYSAGEVARVEDELAVEEPLEIRVRGRAISVTMRTPENDDELAVGFLLTEGVIRRGEDVLSVEPCDQNDTGNVVNVKLAADVHVDFEKLSRHVFASSSCGLCGKATIASLRALFPAISSDLQVSADRIAKLPEVMRAAQPTFARTGGLHAAALFDQSGNLLVLREDVGRHNAVDKVIGHALLKRTDTERGILLVSGRSSFEIMQKALAARIPIVAAVSAPSSLAVEFARENKQTLIGFLREARMNIYSHPDRIRFA